MTKNSNLKNLADDILTKEDFQLFLKELLNDLHNNRDDWENSNLDDYLESLIGFCQDIEGYYKNFNKKIDINQPTWKVFAEMLLAARIYE